MHIVVAPDSFKDALDAARVAAAIARGLRAELRDVTLDLVPLADGGEGTLDALLAATGGTRIAQQVIGPLGTPVLAHYGLLGDGRTAVIELAQASGLEHVPAARRNPELTTSYGTGELVRAALAHRPARLILGIGGSATNDGGAGLCQALGVRFFDAAGACLERPLSGGDLHRVARLDATGLDARLATVAVQVACDVDNPLCGPCGASAVYGPQKGATPTQVAALDRTLADFYAQVEHTLGCAVTMLPGAGAAGGVGAALAAFVGADLRRGIEIVIDAVDLRARMARADLVITGEGALDAQTRHGKTPAGVARLARDLGIAVVALGGSLADEAMSLQGELFDALEAATVRPSTVDAALAACEANVERAARRIAGWLKLAQRTASMPV